MHADPDVPTSLGLDAWLARLAEPTGAPGGGSAAGVMMALAAALLHMVCAYTPGEGRAAVGAERVRALRERSLEAAREDGVRSSALGAALAADGPDRSRGVHDAAVAAAASSADLAEIGVALADELHAVAEVGNRNLVADTGVAAEALRAGLGAALINLRANVQLARSHQGDADAAGELDRLTEIADRVAQRRSGVEELLASLPVG